MGPHLRRIGRAGWAALGLRTCGKATGPPVPSLLRTAAQRITPLARRSTRAVARLATSGPPTMIFRW